MFPRFAHPDYLLWLGVVIPVGLWFVYALFRAQLAARGRWGEDRLVDRHTRQIKIFGVVVNASCWIGILCLLMAGIAQPTAPDEPDKVRSGSMDIVGLFDVSPSIRIEDYRGQMPGSEPGSTVATGASGNRLHMARLLTEQIMRSTSGNYMGLITYQGKGWRIFPKVTNDYSGLRFIMDVSLKPGMASGDGSNVAAGLAEAMALLGEYKDDGRQKVIVLFSDGGMDGSSEELGKALQAMKDAGVRLIVVGLGGQEELPVPVYNDKTGAFEKYLELKQEDCPETAPDCTRTSIVMENLQAIAKAVDGEVHWVEPGQTTIQIQWASALGGTMDAPQGKPLFDWCIYGIIVLLFILSYPGISRRREVV